MNKTKKKNLKSERRAKRTRAKIFGTIEKPRLSIFRSNKYMYAQLIDDSGRKTILSISTRIASEKNKIKKDSSEELGAKIGAKAIEKGIKKAVLDRGKYKYHGKIKIITEAARKAGLLI